MRWFGRRCRCGDRPAKVPERVALPPAPPPVRPAPALPGLRMSVEEAVEFAHHHGVQVVAVEISADALEPWQLVRTPAGARVLKVRDAGVLAGFVAELNFLAGRGMGCTDPRRA